MTEPVPAVTTPTSEYAPPPGPGQLVDMPDDVAAAWRAAEAAPKGAPAVESGTPDAPTGEQIGSFRDDTEAEAAETDAETPAAEAEAAAETEETPEKSEGLAADRKQLEALAKKLGMVVKDDRVHPRERAAFSTMRRKELARIEAQDKERYGQFEQAKQRFLEEHRPFINFKAAFDAGDPDGMAAALSLEHWNDLNADMIAKLSDPNAKRTRELERSLKERDAREAAEKREAAAREHHAKTEAGVTRFKQGITSAATESRDRLAKAMADEPIFVQTVFSVMMDHVDPVTKTTLSVEEALDTTLPNGQTLRANLQALRKRLNSGFGEEPAVAPGKAPAKAAPAAVARPAAPTQRRAQQGSAAPRTPSARSGDVAREDFIADFRARNGV